MASVDAQRSKGRVLDLGYLATAARYRSLGRALEECGSTLYTRFLIKNGRRPDPNEATAIGHLMGCRVRASDLNFYPALDTQYRTGRRNAFRPIDDAG